MRKITDKLIEVVVNGEFWNSENHLVPYRVKISMPDCMDEYMVSNIKRRYLFKAVKSGMEYIGEGK
jgi:hypothetical protein